MRHMLDQIAVDHVFEPWGFAQIATLAQWVAALIDEATQLAGAFPDRCHAPFGPAANRHAALAPCEPVIQHEGSRARSQDADRQPPDLGVEDLVIPILFRDQLAHCFIVQSQSLDHARTSCCA